VFRGQRFLSPRIGQNFPTASGSATIRNAQFAIRNSGRHCHARRFTVQFATMTRTDQLRALLNQRILVCDGATGTQLQLLGLQPGECGLRWNTDAPDRIREVHQRYLDAGATLLTTNTFSGTTLALTAHGLEARAAELNRAGAALARSVAGDRAFVLGDIGPFGGLLEPYGDTPPDVAEAAFGAQAAALLEGGADAILVETMSDPTEAALALSAARGAGAAFVIVTFTFQRSPAGFRTMMGSDVATALRAVSQADVVGANCGTELSLADYAQLAAELVGASGGRPVIVQPNAGSPALEQGRLVYRTGPKEFGQAAERFLDAGVRIVGGCCGTGPAHIAALAASVARRL
jgi:5-methyltetrahydrofolate--homocysteine methyltransferase